MEFSGPTRGDFANVAALNALFLDMLADTGGPEWPRLSALSGRRLAEAPFLLFSLREGDQRLWQGLLEGGGQLPLRSGPPTRDARPAELRIVAVGFLWQIARRNPYAARLVSAAPQEWCEDIGARTLVQLVRGVSVAEDLVTMRFPATSAVWQRMLIDGTSSSRMLRRSAHLAALQQMLTQGAEASASRLAAAACGRRNPAVSRRAPRV